MNIRYIWVIMAVISVVLFLFQSSVDGINANGTTLYNYEGGIIDAYSYGNYTGIVDPSQGIPELEAEVSTGGDSGYTDIFQSIKSWFQDTKTGKIIGGLYYAVPNIIKGMGLPNSFSFALGLLWTLIAIFSFVMFMRGLT